MQITSRVFGKTAEGLNAELFRITNSTRAYVELSSYGAALVAASMPDKDGAFADVLVGYDSVDGLSASSGYQGQTVGRFANRIAGGRFTIDGAEYQLARNENGLTCLHSGGELSYKLWDAEANGEEGSVVFTAVSPDGTNGFPGTVRAQVKFTFTEENRVILEYSAVSDKATIFSMTNHAYFNLGGFDSGDILGHELQIFADEFVPIDENSIPTGELRHVVGTPFDFNTAKLIGRDIGADYEQLAVAGGYDHNFCLCERGDKKPCAVARDPKSGRTLKVYTDLPGVQFYTGNFLKGETGKGGAPMIKHAGFCLETQVYPDSPNQNGFPECRYAAGEKYHTRTVFEFGVSR